MEYNFFWEDWGIKKRISSAHYPQNNGWIKLAVKTAKQLLMDCIDDYGHLRHNQAAWAMRMHRNTPHQDLVTSRYVVWLSNKKITSPYFARSTRFINVGGRQRNWGKGWWQKDTCWTRSSTTCTVTYSKSFRLANQYRCKIRRDHIHSGGWKQGELLKLWATGNTVYGWTAVAELHYLTIGSSIRFYQM